MTLDDQLRDLLSSYAEPCIGDCDHSQCPLLRELHALRIKATLERARLTVKPVVDREKRGEEVGDLMNIQLRTDAPADTRELARKIITPWVIRLDKVDSRLPFLLADAITEAITTFTTTHGEERWREGLQRALDIADSDVTLYAEQLAERGDEGRDILNYTDFIKGQKTAARGIRVALNALLPQREEQGGGVKES